ncbi:hypothetical protein HI850_009140 [bacterium SPL81]|nr:hypothetical protein [Acinetobacter baumannii]
MSHSSVDPSRGQFIDPMFAVVIAAAVSETIIIWVKGETLPTLFQASVVTLGYINLLLSWFGYHKSISKKPILGSLRFINTVVLLPLYLLTIILFDKNFFHVALVYAGVFFLWTCWEYLKYIEHGEKKGFISLLMRGFNLIVFGVVIYLYVVSILPISWQQHWFVNHSNGIALAFLTLAIFTLRIVKSAGKGDTVTSRILTEIKTLLFGAKESSTT